MAYGEYDESMEVCHKCDTPLCVRPDHLFLGTHQENMDDMHNKERDNLQTTVVRFVFVSPHGDIIRGTNMSRWCRDNGLHAGYMRYVRDGKLKAYKGWTRYAGE
jgi:hypothetical protein